MRRHDQPPRAFFSTCPDDRAVDIVSAYIQRWSIETTPDQVRGRLFEESRAHLGFETQRQWSDLATERATPSLLGLYSIVVLLVHGLYRAGGLSVRRLAWYDKQQATFSDTLAAVRYHLWEVAHFSTSPPNSERVETSSLAPRLPCHLPHRIPACNPIKRR